MLYRIAGLTVRMDTFGQTERQARSYGIDTDTPPDVTVRTDPAAFQRKHPHLSLDECEYLTTGASFSRQLIDFDGLTLHASAIEVDGYAYLFSAPAGTGKSTHTSLWRSVIGSGRVRVINDDKPAMRLVDGVWYAYGTPWSGMNDAQRNVRVPIGGICFLERGDRVEIARLRDFEAACRLLSETPRPREAERLERLLDLTDALVGRIPAWRLVCTPTEEAARAAILAMTAEPSKGEVT